MERPQSMDVSSTQPLVGRLVRAYAALDGASKLAIVCVVFGWFFSNTLVVNLGSLQHGVRFFDMAAVIADPMRLFFGVDNSLQRVLFGVICLLCLMAPALPHVAKQRSMWLAYLAPLALMVLCGGLLYTKTSGELFAAPGNTRVLGTGILRFANDLVRHGSDLVARRVSIGAGGYLALIGSAVLAVQGIRQYRRPA
jgi:hypothetical protein